LRGVRLDVLGLELTPVHLAGLVIVVFGLHLAGLLRVPWLYRERRFRVEPSANFARAVLLGAAFAFGWTPCIGPVLAGILTLAAGQETLWRGTFLLALYSAGLAIPFVAMAASLDRFYAVFGRVKRYFRAIEIGSGALLVAAGLLVMTGRLTLFNRYLRFMSDLVLGLEKWLL
jgi:cytochrome c-type biogenesis protein